MIRGKIMRKLLIFLVCVGFVTSIYACCGKSEGDDLSINEKFYVSAENIFFDQNQLFVNFGEQLLKIHRIVCDNKGIYFTQSDLADGNEYYCTCAKGHTVPCYYDICPCGATILRR